MEVPLQRTRSSTVSRTPCGSPCVAMAGGVVARRRARGDAPVDATRCSRVPRGSTSGSSAARPLLIQLLHLGQHRRALPASSDWASRSARSSSSADMNQLFSAAAAAALGLVFNEAAYMAEIVRAGIISVDEGQTEAAASLGMTGSQTMRRIVLPQAMRVIVPPTGNEVIVDAQEHVAGLRRSRYLDLTFSAQTIYARTYQIIPMLIMACLWYLAMSSVLMIGQFYIERHFAKGTVRNLPPTPVQRVRLLFSAHGRDSPVTAAAHGQGRGGPQVVRRRRRPQGHRPRGGTERGVLPRRALRLGQVHVPALHQPPREDRRRPAVGRRSAGGLPAEGRQAATSSRRARWPHTAATSAWCSSGSTCSRT